MTSGPDVLAVEYPRHTSKITDEAIAELKSLIGQEIRIPVEDWRIEDAKYGIGDIKVLCRAIGDFNPLFFDPEYAKETRYGRQVVPPSIIAEMLQIDPGREVLRGSRPILEAVALEWQIPILDGDAVLGKTCVSKVEEVAGSSSDGRVVRQEYETTITNQRGETVGTAKHTFGCYERGSAAEAALFSDREPAIYNRDEIEAIHQEYRGEAEANVIRSGESRKWDEVRVGERPRHILKGPTTPSAAPYLTKRVNSPFGLGYSGGIHRWYDGLDDIWEKPERWPELFLLNEHGAPEPLEAIEWTHVRSMRFLKLPAKEANSERIHWTAQLLTSWMGDDGFLKRLGLKFPRINIQGDITRCYGKVSGKRVDDGKHLVEVEVWNINGVGDTVTTGTAEIILP